MTVSGAGAADLLAKINRAMRSSSGTDISIVQTLTTDQLDFIAMLAQWTMGGERYVDTADPALKQSARQQNISKFVFEYNDFSNKKPLYLLKFISKLPGFVGYWQTTAAGLLALPDSAQPRTVAAGEEKGRLSGIYEQNIKHLITALGSGATFCADEKTLEPLKIRRSWTSVEPDERRVTDLYFNSLIKSLQGSGEKNPEEMAIISLYKGNKTKGTALADLSEKLALSTFYSDFERRVLQRTVFLKYREEVSLPIKVAVTMAGLLKYADERGVRFGESGRTEEKALAQEVVHIMTGQKYGLKNKPITKDEFDLLYFTLCESVRWLGNFDSLASAFEVEGLAREITRKKNKADIHRRNVFLCACIAWSENDQNREGIDLVGAISRKLGQDPLDTIGQYARIDHKFGFLGYVSRRSYELNRPLQYKDLVE